MRRFLDTDLGAWVTPCALVAGLLVAVYGLGGCANNPIGGKTLEQFWDQADRDRPARRP